LKDYISEGSKPRSLAERSSTAENQTNDFSYQRGKRSTNGREEWWGEVSWTNELFCLSQHLNKQTHTQLGSIEELM